MGLGEKSHLVEIGLPVERESDWGKVGVEVIDLGSMARQLRDTRDRDSTMSNTSSRGTTTHGRTSGENIENPERREVRT